MLGIKKNINNIIKKLYTIYKIYKFKYNGSVPWSDGYNEYKWDTIIKVINDGFIENVGSKNFGYRIDERVVEIPWVFTNITDEEENFLDAGSALNYECLLYRKIFEKKHIYITTLTPESNAFYKRSISYIYEDIRHSCFKDNFFDSIACISTLEHVGMDNTMLYSKNNIFRENNCEDYIIFLNSLKRILKPGGQLLLTIPFGIYKNMGWFQVFDSMMVNKIIDLFSQESTEKIFKYENDRWNFSDRQSCLDATCFDIHATTDYENDYLAFSRAICCLRLIK